MSRAPVFPCPCCRRELHQVGTASITGLILPETDPEGKARLELEITCEACEQSFFAFVARDEVMDANGDATFVYHAAQTAGEVAP